MSFLSFLLLSMGIQQPPNHSVEEILSEVRKRQSQLSSIELIIEANSWTAHSLLNRPLEFRRTIHVWKDGDKCRTDHNTPIAEDIDTPRRHTICVNGEGKGTIFNFLDHVKGSSRLGASLEKTTPEDLKSRTIIMTDPVKLAFVTRGPMTHWEYSSPELIVRPAEGASEVVTLTRWKDREAFCVTVMIKDTKIESWFDRAQPYLCYSVKESVASDSWTVESKFEDRELARFGIPSEYSSRVVENGKEIRRETGTVRAISINKKIDPNVFKVIGMDLPEGTPVSGSGMDGLRYWDGKSLVDPQVFDFKKKVTEVKAAEAGDGRSKFLQVAVIAGGIALVCVCFLLIRKRQTKTEK
jgi:hypothetical protein